MNRDIFLSILAMDSYNRGYGVGLNVDGSGIGGAQILSRESIGVNDDIYQAWEEAGFYAVAYDVGNVFGFSSGETAISYRGTDLKFGDDEGGDVNNGYLLAAGDFMAPQADLALKFYRSVIGMEGGANPFGTNVITTGHSLGGGLAGYIARLYGLHGTVFDNMPFELAATFAYGESIIDPLTHIYLYGPNAAEAPTNTNLSAFATTGEFLAAARGLQSLDVTYLDSNGGTRSPFDLHSMSLHVLLQYARHEESLEELDWINAGPDFIDSLFSNAIADALPIAESLKGRDDAVGVMRAALAYSAIDEGVLVFGDTGIRALFDDATDLGKALGGANPSSSIAAGADAISQILVQYAAKLALGKVEKASDASALEGIVVNNGEALSVDFTDAFWDKGAHHTSIVGRETLINRSLSRLSIGIDPFAPGVVKIRSDLEAGLRWFAGNNNIEVATPAEVIDRVAFQISSGSFIGSVPDRPQGAASDRLSLFVAGDGDDAVTGSAENDFIHAGGGNDTLFGGAGDDILAGGAGDDNFKGGSGRDFFAGGSGTDVIDLQLGVATQGIELQLSAVDATNNTEQSTFELTLDGETDRAVDIERIDLTAFSDTVQVDDLGAPDGPQAPMGRLNVDFGAGPIAIDADMLDFSNAGRASGASTAFGLMTADAGVHVDLRNASDQTVSYYYDWGALHTTGTDVRLRASNANSVTGTAFDDYLIGNGGKAADGEGYSTLRGGGGDDTLEAAGWETHMNGGEGSDRFMVGANTWVEGGETQDTVFYAGFPIFGGVKQWWMEGGTAYWAPFSSVMAAFPVIGSAILNAAAFFIEAATMKFASYQRDENGNLNLNLGWGHGGTATITDYSLDLDSGVSTAGVTVFEQRWAKEASLENLTKYVNLALKAGFGFGLNGFDPLVLDLDGDGYELTTQANSRAYFEFDSDGFAERTGWVGADDGLLAIDLNTNGTIDGLTELFGNQTTSGFTMLAAYDGNADGVINASDAAFANLRIWQDIDQDGVSDAGELKTLTEAGIASIDLASNAPSSPTGVGGNQIARTGSFTRANGTTGAIADVAFDVSETATRWLGDTTVSASVALLPQLRGFGEVKDLRVAMTGDASLEALVSDFVENPTSDLEDLKADAEAILYAWAGVSDVTADAIGSNGFDVRKLAFLEKYSGHELMPRDGTGAVELTNLAEMEDLWADQVTRLTLRLVVQGPLADVFASIEYRADLDLLVAGSATALGDLYANLLADLPSDPVAALSQWQNWAPLLGAMAEGMVRFDNNVVRDDFIAAQLLAAMDGINQPLDFQALVTALGIDDLRIGTSGTDTLTRGSATDSAIYVSGGGNDTLNGGTGQDVYIFDRMIGNVVINDEEARAAGDRVRFAFLTADDVTLTRSNDDLLITVTATGETVRVTGQFAPVVPLGSDVLLSSNKGIEDIQFADGEVFEMPEIMSAVGTGTSGDDMMSGTMHSDVFLGGLGNDTMEGGDDADLYVVNAGEGQDVIREAQSTVLLRAADMVIFGDDIAPEDLTFSRQGASGGDLLISIGHDGQSLLIKDQFGYSSLGYNAKFATNSRIEAFGFREYGTSWSNIDIQRRLIADATTNGADTTRGFGDDDVFGASAGNDTLIGMDGADVYQWGAGSGNDTIDEQAQFIDVSVGLGGLNLTVRADTVVFDEGITASDLVFSRLSAAPDLTVTLTETGETLTVKNQFAGFQTGVLGAHWFNRVEWFTFADGTKLSWQDVALLTTTGGSGDDQLFGDVLPDHFEGGAGDDVMSGFGAGDTYVFNAGDGHDTLVDADTSFLGSGFLTVDPAPDVLVLGEGLNAADVTFERDGRSVTMVFGNGDDRVTLTKQDEYIYTGVFGTLSSYRIEEIRFYDGTVWSWHDLNQRMIEVATTAGDDLTLGTSTDDVFAASSGDDVLDGSDGSDIYAFGRGSGHDVIRDHVDNIFAGENDKIIFGPGIVASDLAFSREGDDLVITITDTGDTLRIEQQFDYYVGIVWHDVELFEFADGSTLTNGDIQQILVTGGSGNDTLIGFGTNDQLDGGAGDDTMHGKDGDDTYIFGRGYGHDTIYESVKFANVGDNDRVLFKEGVTLSDLVFSRMGDDDLVISIVGTSDELKIVGEFSLSAWFTWQDIERFEFADGSFITKEEVMQLVLVGTLGNDDIVGFNGDDVLDGGAGDDVLVGRDGNDTYRFGVGDGHDEIHEQLVDGTHGEGDILAFKSGVMPADVTVTREGQDAIFTLASGESIRVHGQFNEGYNEFLSSNDVEQVTFADGTIWDKIEIDRRSLHATSGDDIMLGTWYSQSYEGLAGNDTIYAGAGVDQIAGGAGDDRLEGGAGNDTYFYALGDGEDVIFDYDFWGNGYNILKFGPGITSEDLIISGNPNNSSEMRISFANSPGSILVANQWVNDSAIERFEFADGSSWGVAEMAAAYSAGQSTSGDDVIYGTVEGNWLAGGTGNDQIYGGEGDDTYLFNTGDGSDTVFDRGRDGLYYNTYWDGGNDRIVFGPNIAPADITVTQVNSNDIRLSINGTADSLLIRDVLSHPEAVIDRIEFADGTIWTYADVLTRSLAATSGNDVHYAGFTPSTLEGGAGSDTLFGSVGTDTLSGGADADQLYAGEGDDTYRFDRGDGSDTVFDRGRDGLYYNTYWDGGNDRIVFAPNIAPADITVTQINSNDVLLAIAGTTDSVLLKDVVSHAEAVIERIDFADGTVWTYADLMDRALAPTPGNDVHYAGFTPRTLEGGAGSDTLFGSSGADSLAGGTDADQLYGAEGDDTYRFGRGDGSDMVFDRGRDGIFLNTYWDGGNDKIVLGPNIVQADVTVTQVNSHDILVTIAGTTDSLLLKDVVSHAEAVIERIEFADGTAWTYADLMERALAPTSGNDVRYAGFTPRTLEGGAGDDSLTGSGGADILSGGAGTDQLNGGEGDDIYRFSWGDGPDTVFDRGRDGIFTYQSGGNDKIVFGPGIAATNIVVSQTNRGAIMLAMVGTSDSLTIAEAIVNSGATIELVEFDDGTTWSGADMLAMIEPSPAWIRGGEGGDWLVGGSSNEIYAGNGGNDSIEGREGSDTYRYASGDGSDNIWDSGAAGDVDVLKLTDLTPANVTLRRFATHLYVRDNATGQETRVQDQFHSDERYGIEQLVFADGTVWDRQQIEGLAWVTGGNGNEELYGSSLSDILIGNGGNDYMEGRGSGDTYVYASGDGSDRIADDGSTGDVDKLKLTDLNASAAELSRGGKDLYVRDVATGQSIKVDNQFDESGTWGIEQLVFADETIWNRSQIQAAAWYRGGGGNDEIYASGLNDTLVGNAGNDRLEGYSGSDTYRYGAGDGADTIRDFGSSADVDVLKLTNLNPEQIEFSRGGNDLYFRDLSTGQQTRVQNHFDGSGNWGLEQVVFADGTIWDGAQIQAAAWYRGGVGNDEIYASGLNDTLVGNAGNDWLEGYSGSDTYRYASGDGSDTIRDSGTSTDVDILKLTNLNSDQVEFSRGGNDLYFRDLLTGQQTRVQNHFDGSGNWGLEQVVFADGTIWDRAQIQAAAWYRGGVGNDEIYASGLNDTLVGNAGNDWLEGYSGSDTYRYGSGDGSDRIWDSGSTSDVDVLKLTNLNPGDVSLRRDGPHLYVRDNSLGQEIRIDNQFNSDERYGVEQISFADGTTWNRSQISAISATLGDDTITGTAEDDWLFGLDGSDTLEGMAGDDALTGGLGNDILRGGEGNDTYRFDIGGGNDAISDTSSSSSDTLLLGAGIAAADVIVTRVNNYQNLLLTIGSGSVLIQGGVGAFDNVGIDRVHFADGTQWTRQQLLDRADLNFAPTDIVFGGVVPPPQVTGAGSVSVLSENVYELTPNAGGRIGAIWGAVDLSSDVTWTTRMYFGANDGGADGLSFGLQNASSTALGGNGAIMNGSLGIWFDTYQNSGEPGDFSQIVLNGNVGDTNFDAFHAHGNLEDNAWHNVVIHWNAASKTLGYSFDGVEVSAKSYDVVNNLFSGDSTAFFGFGARTGGASNQHAVELVSMVAPVALLSVASDAAGGVLVGTLATVDPNVGEQSTFAIVDASGNTTTDPYFVIDGNGVRVKTGADLGAIGEQSYTFRIKATDAGGASLVEDVTIAITPAGGPGDSESFALYAPVEPSLNTVGAALIATEGYVQLTSNAGNQTGAVWGSVDLTKDTIWTTKMFFGGSDGGADGVSFALQGSGNNVLGAKGALTSQSLGVLFDTYVNSGEPNGDYSKIVLNGSAQTHNIDFFHVHPNIEDNAWHDVVIRWDADTRTLAYSLDGVQVSSRSLDPANDPLSGLTSAYYGFGAATGGAANYQSVDIDHVLRETSSLSVRENSAAGALVGVLAPSEHLLGAGYSFEIVDANGDAVTDPYFTIGNDGALRVKQGAIFNRQEESAHGVRIQVLDAQGRNYVADVSITIVGSGLSGDAGDNELTGTSGNDMIFGEGGSDSLYGLAGDDVLNGGAGNDHIDGGQGTDIVDYSDHTIGVNVDLSSSSAQTVASGESDTLIGIEGVRGGSANDILWSGSADNILDGGAGNDALYGRQGDDILVGGTGNDTLYGAAGADIYRFNLGDGQDSIREYDGSSWDYSNDAIEFGAGITASDITVVQGNNGNDLVIQINGTNDQLTLANTLTGAGEKMEAVRFVDGTVLTYSDLVARSIMVNGGNDTFYGSSYEGDTLTGGAGNDTLYARQGNDVLSGGTGNDILYGAAGADTYRFNLGDGQDSVREYDGSSWDYSSDAIEFGAGITASDITVVQGNNGNDLVIQINGTNDQLTLVNTLTGAGEKMEAVRFVDGTVLTYSDLVARSIMVNGGNDTFYGSSYEGDTLTGGAGNDTLYARQGNDVLSGGTGNDILYGAAGADTYRFNLGDGQDSVREYDGSSWDYSSDAIEFGAGITASDITVVQGNNGNDLVIQINGTSDQLTLVNTLTGAGEKMEAVRFVEGTVLTYSDLVARSTMVNGGNDTFYGSSYEGDALNGGAGHDTLYGRDGNDVLTGGTGNDTLFGGSGSDIAVFTGLQAAYSIVTTGGTVTVTDNEAGADGDDGVDTISSIETLRFKGGVEVGVTSPIILDLDGRGVQTVSASKSKARFDLDQDGFRDDTSWIGKTEGILFLDRDHDGTVTNAGEISFSDDAPLAPSDLAGLVSFDTNSDGQLSSADDRFKDFGVWIDRDSDGKVDNGEVKNLSSAGVASINLTATAVAASTKFGETAVVHKGSYTRTDGRQMEYVDAALTYYSGKMSGPLTGVAPAASSARGLSIFGLASDSAAFDRYVVGEFNAAETLSSFMRTAFHPSEKVPSDGSLVSHDHLGFTGILALMRQNMAAFGNSGGEGLSALRAEENLPQSLFGM